MCMCIEAEKIWHCEYSLIQNSRSPGVPADLFTPPTSENAQEENKVSYQ